MKITKNLIQKHIKSLSLMARSLHPHLEVFPLIYDPKSFRQDIKSAIDPLHKKEWCNSLKLIIKREFQPKKSKFLGLNVYKKPRFWGLKRQETYMGVFTLDISTMKSLDNVSYNFWHMISHCLETINLKNDEKYEESFKTGPIIPKRPFAQAAHVNLKADVFALLVASYFIDQTEFEKLIRSVCEHVMVKQNYGYVETFPIPIALEHIYFAAETIQTSSNTADALKLSLDLSREIVSVFDKKILTEWFHFARSSQELLWLDHKPSEVLSAAINTSESSFVRSISGTLSDLLEITPYRGVDTNKYYNPFLAPRINARAHYKECESTFESILYAAYAEHSTKRLQDETIRQCRELLSAKCFGFNAHALIACENYIRENNLLSNNLNTSIATISDDDVSELYKKKVIQITWEQLHSFSVYMMKIMSSGKFITFSELQKHMQQTSDFVLINDVFDVCLKHDENAFEKIPHVIFKPLSQTFAHKSNSENNGA